MSALQVFPCSFHLILSHLVVQHCLSPTLFSRPVLHCSRFHLSLAGSRRKETCPATEECSAQCPLGPILGLWRNRACGPPNVARSPCNLPIRGEGESLLEALDFHFSECACSPWKMPLSTPPPQLIPPKPGVPRGPPPNSCRALVRGQTWT